MTRVRAALAACSLLALAAACDGGSSTGLARAPVSFTRFLPDGSTVAPVLAEAPTGFDALQVDGPAIAHDASRNDPFLLYYEATDPTGFETIGLVTALDAGFQTVSTTRTRVIDRGASGLGVDDIGASDPTVLVDPSVPFGQPGRYKLWYEGRSGVGGALSTIVVATSSDGLAWTDFRACTGLTPGSEVSFASIRVADPSVVLDGATYKMWFEAIDAELAPGVDGAATIGYAESPDGVAWTVQDAQGSTGAFAAPVLRAGRANGFNGFSVKAPSVTMATSTFAGEPFVMLYEAHDEPGDVEGTLGFALSADGRTWRRFDLPVLIPSDDGLAVFDSGGLLEPSVLVDSSLAATAPGHFKLYYAASADGGGGASAPRGLGLALGNRSD